MYRGIAMVSAEAVYVLDKYFVMWAA